MMGAPDLWINAVDQVRTSILPDNYENWIKPLRFVAEVDNSIVVAAKDQFTLDRVNADYALPLQRAWKSVDPKQRRLKIQYWKSVNKDVREMVGDPWIKPELPSPSAKVRLATKAAEEPADLKSVSTMTFETLVVGESNTKAVKLGRKLASSDAMMAGVFVVFGEPGTGKTHLIKAIEIEAVRANPDLRVTLVSAEEFMSRFSHESQEGNTKDLQALMKQNDLLLIDDLHWIAGKQKTDKAFFAAIRAVTNEGGRVVITADVAPVDMVGLSQKLSNELKGAAQAQVDLPDSEMRRDIVRRHSALIQQSMPNFILTDEMITRLVSGVRGPGRELCGALWTLQVETGFGEQAPTLEMVDEVVRTIAGTPRDPSLDDIKRAMMDLFQVSKSQIESGSKVRSICYPRQLGMYLSRVMTDKSYPQIATAYRKKDHTTPLHAYRKIKRLLGKADPDTLADIEKARTAVFERMAQVKAKAD